MAVVVLGDVTGVVVGEVVITIPPLKGSNVVDPTVEITCSLSMPSINE